MLELETELLYEAHVDLAQPIVVGQTPESFRYIVNVTGGTIEGPNIKGKFLASGADWLRVRNDGSMALDVRACIETDDGDVIYATYPGRILADEALVPKILDFSTAQNIDPSEYYFRVLPTFETASEKYHWLNHVCAVGVGRTGNGGVTYKVYRIL